MKKFKILAVVASALALCFCLAACGDTIINVGTVYERADWAGSYFNADRYKYDNDKDRWSAETVYQASYEKIASMPDNYRKIKCDVKSKFKTNEYRLLSVAFVVKPEVNCQIDFTIVNRMFYAETLGTSFEAGKEQRVVIEVDKLFTDIMTSGSDVTPSSGFDIASYQIEKIEDWKDGDYWNEEVIGVKYAAVYKDPEVKYTISSIQLVIEKIK